MARIAVFAGLGSESLFSDTTLRRAAQDGSLPESQVLLRCCHSIFRTQVAAAVRRKQLPPGSIDLDDFQRPDDLLKPHLKYRRNATIQHTTIFLVQILRYLGTRSNTTAGRLCGAAGFCVGLFPAATILTAGPSDDNLEFLQRAIDFFHITLWLGIHCESFRLEQLTRNGCRQDLPWSIVVDNAPPAISEAFDRSQDLQDSIYVSAKSSTSCFTLSGRGDELEKYISQGLEPQCRTRATPVFTLYHHERSLQAVFNQTMESLKRELPSRLSTPIRLSAPLFSTVQGAPDITGEMSLQQLVILILGMILQKPVDWVWTQNAVLAQVQRQAGSEDGSGSDLSEVLNYGPGYGMSRSAVAFSSPVQIRDVSAMGSHSKSDSHVSSSILPDDVAIVGMAVDLPDASNTDELWDNLVNGRNSVSEVSFIEKSPWAGGARLSLTDMVCTHASLDPGVSIPH